MNTTVSTIPTPKLISSLEETSETVRANQERRAARAAETECKSKAQSMAVLVILITVIALVAVFAHNTSENARFERVYDLPRMEIVVHQGDTIDGVAAENPVEGLSAHELGYVIADINEGAHSVPLMPGDRLMIPVEDAR